MLRYDHNSLFLSLVRWLLLPQSFYAHAKEKGEKMEEELAYLMGRTKSPCHS